MPGGEPTVTRAWFSAKRLGLASPHHRAFFLVFFAMAVPTSSRLFLRQAAKQLFAAANPPTEAVPVVPPRLTLRALEALRMSRSRDRILANLDEMYREAFDRAKATGDQTQMATLDFAYRREQLYFEILLDVRDAVEKR
jgi:hypothetical protein